MPSLARMLNEHVTPLMKEHGWTKNRTRYWREWGEGNSQTIDFDEFRMPGPNTHLFLNLGVDTYGYRFITSGSAPPSPGEQSASMFHRNALPESPQEGEDGRWLLRPDEQLGPLIAQHLHEHWLAEFDQWTDLGWIENEVRTNEHSPWFPSAPFNIMKLPYVIAAQRDDPEIDELIDELERLGNPPEIIEPLRTNLPRGTSLR